MKWTRRRVVTTTVAAAALAGCLGEDGSDESGAENANEDDDRDAEAVLEDADLEDYTGQEGVDVAVDPDGAGFEPEVIEIDSDTVINWQWEGSSTGLYPIDIPDECFWDEEDNEDDEWEADDEFDRLFWADGAYLYGSRNDGEEFTGAFRVHATEDEDDEDGSESEGEDGNESENEDDEGGNESEGDTGMSTRIDRAA